MADTAKKQIVVIGLGMTGLSVVNHLLRKGGNVDIKVIDTRVTPPGAEQLPSNVALHAGGWNMDWLLSADQIVASPGVALATPELQDAAAKGIEIVGDIELFARDVSAPVIGITGSNGKSTVTSLVGEMAKAAGVNVGVGGNIGFAALDMLANDHALYVLELSSFQLETTSSLDLASAVFLNLSEDHMDRYTGMDDYRDAKLRIYDQARLAVWNQDDVQTKPLSHEMAISFGFSDGEYTLTLRDGQEWLTAKGEQIMPVSDIALVGRHNVANCLSAMALADSVGIDRQAQCQAMREYRGLAHRCQQVLEQDGVLWVNDSKATNPASTLAALDGLQLAGRLHLLVGGDGKGADFSSLKPVLNTLNVTLYCYGRDGHAFAVLVDAPVVTETMQAAMDIAARDATSGDMVLLSPACASFDQFTNFMVRGDTFAAYAKEIATQRAGSQVSG
ncbi:UDP-N-acetylmuramoyl-L-alanine--D-glutamate ligase [Enterovibrio norvegicus]|uniref:UDP-N-acetylmuramoyl-L-alanine--D-glutamate ligase n=1 Tax=Enterovibrio norvegicus TaxID=188144 RepID=UPI000C85CBBF|nr:UDP-N-acetylmuramoyl-L-alanine--D-glutamate ligase [Enterovibrio norvegicus]MCC4799572.1 UDP-N-acetylmuramoyl-L-alanine--D-glutamate ligase [Enterovibrio norvegicus]PMI31644.1 UDP-N-acetylmuramoyl-L-alanine--D-glutamate ligase [Enterovibrio norvegicus]PMI37234.1 UDP-N-acetylmuramoyl-L-alanine--D-glutamate ligase [Enterovibrio norvegicus]PMN50285.1 UDP-N-acetylmuramoyl-L-alanine--D-glutamate ligase [Enterovibrio norvegicus]TKF16863.1 UDP-N-acetylmuramoyl-L-alanine--D-glutamate ligase [Entero